MSANEYLIEASTRHQIMLQQLSGGSFNVERIDPIETPDEKDLRLREKWCAKAVGVCGLGMLGITTLTRIYDALLSGELTIPSKDGE